MDGEQYGDQVVQRQSGEYIIVRCAMSRLSLSFGDGFETKAGDVFEIGAAPFGQPLQNMLWLELTAFGRSCRR